MKKVILAISVLLLVAGCSRVALTGRKQLLLVSDSEVMSLSNSSFKDYMKTAKQSTNAANKAMVVRVGQRIANAVETYLRTNGMEDQVRNFAWEFHLVQDNTPNAFCMPGGKIVVNEGILPYTKTEEGLAIVLGHEVGHAVAKHSAERISQQMLASYGGQVLSGVLAGKSAETRILAQQVYGLGAQYGVMLPYSRRNESEADHLGLVFAAMAGYNPEAAIAFWQRMSAGGGQKMPQFMSTHPSDEARIRNIKKLLPEAMRYYKPAQQTARPATGKMKKGRSFTFERISK
ncbi:M48 family metallopeptidase [Bacteroides pyogenes]|uniref:M48 family metallopeptidase n=1 Tax=Bacteroides pyogenes TaxID=310300 RepID=UPI0011E441C6|nr:M48 family metallopeptidase [Bacteroides pyogenes]MDY5433633.1 M48 family metallopeptidase [Bacteroides pyogenes]TYK34726.1 M48 family metallopeptidase [Bacteroides pyogenes]